MPEPTDDEKIRTLGARAAALWERIRITVMGLAILASVISSTWVLSGTQSEIQGQIGKLGESVSEVKTAVRSLKDKHEAGQVVQASHDTRLGRIEEWRDMTRSVIQSIERRLEALYLRSPAFSVPEDRR